MTDEFWAAPGSDGLVGPSGRVFREWVAVPRPDRRRWRALLAEAKAFVSEQVE